MAAFCVRYYDTALCRSAVGGRHVHGARSMSSGGRPRRWRSHIASNARSRSRVNRSVSNSGVVRRLFATSAFTAFCPFRTPNGASARPTATAFPARSRRASCTVTHLQFQSHFVLNLCDEGVLVALARSRPSPFVHGPLRDAMRRQRVRPPFGKKPVEVGNGLDEPFAQLSLGLPAEQFPGFRNVRSTLPWIVRGQRL